jgi:hypothetical protein
MGHPTDKRQRLDEILDGKAADFNDLWNRTEAAGEHELLPAGRYKGFICAGGLATSKANKTPSYKLVFEILEPAAFRGRRVYHDCWLTPAALPVSKRDLAKCRIHTPAQLQQRPPVGLVADLRIALRTTDDDRQFNRVVGFVILDERRPADLAPTPAEGDTWDDDDFDWSAGVQH